MTVVCPSCEARFRDPPADVLATSNLQCSKCEHQWVPRQGEPLIKMDSPSLVPDMADLVVSKQTIKTKLPVVMPDLEAADTRQPVYVDRAVSNSAGSTPSLAWPAAALAGLIVLAGSVGLRETVMDQVPATTPYYQAAGLVSKTPGLQIGNVVTTKSSRDGIRQLIVKGEIKNIANNTVPVPPIVLTMRGKVDTNLYAWTVTAKKKSLKAGEKSRFTAVAHDFPAETVNVEVEFAPAKTEGE